MYNTLHKDKQPSQAIQARMYIVNRRQKSKRRVQTAVLVLLFVGVLAGSGVAAQHYFTPETKISRTPAPVVTKVLGAKSKTRTFTTGVVSFDLPQDWEQFTPVSPLADTNYWRNTAGNKGVRVVSLKVGAIPPDIAFNRVLAVQTAENRIVPLGSVSDNCVNFSGQGRQTGGSGKSPARWDGVQFTCDTGNYVRNVVGISSAETPNGVRLAGASGTHLLSMTFTDSDVTPKHSIFTNAVESLRVKQ